MNIHSAPAAQRDTRPAEANGAAAAHEIKYREDAVGYVAAMLAELRQIAGKAGIDKLVKSIDAAYYDAYGALDARAREAAAAPQNPPPQKTSNAMEPNGA